MKTKNVVTLFSLVVIIVAMCVAMSFTGNEVPITYDGSDVDVTELYANPSGYDVSNPDGVADVIVKTDIEQANAQNAVAAVVFDYRGFDTIGESFILLASIAGAHVILQSSKKKKEEKEKKKTGRQFKAGITEKNIVIKNGADSILPFAIIFGMAVILFGVASPGGGFQGGVIVSSAALLVYLGYGTDNAKKAINEEFIRVNEAIGAILYVVFALCGVFLGARFCENVFAHTDLFGNIFSGGTISLMSVSVGYKVLTGVGFLLLLMLGLLAQQDEE